MDFNYRMNTEYYKVRLLLTQGLVLLSTMTFQLAKFQVDSK